MAKASKKYRYGWIDGVKWPEFVTQMSISASDFPALLVIDAPKKVHLNYLVAHSRYTSPLQSNCTYHFFWIAFTESLCIFIVFILAPDTKELHAHYFLFSHFGESVLCIKV